MNVDFVHDRPVRLGTATVRHSASGAVVRRADTSVEAALNPTAFALWELCDGDTSVAEMVAAICQLFDVSPERATSDVAHGMQQLRESGLIS